MKNKEGKEDKPKYDFSEATRLFQYGVLFARCQRGLEIIRENLEIRGIKDIAVIEEITDSLLEMHHAYTVAIVEIAEQKRENQ